ncbi:hypothetical protein BDV96DRAFT_650894 [Lophiotrema nucula]|uniref:Rhodopsin domain-containing protein n=1 Tax=Lophiotrema nucula TaxID=690887 RepID=A0A6A5YT82_9PLEO|nr:hypothetical protein BDV96DRAFT_650894 [Lophiotrema nucula]
MIPPLTAGRGPSIVGVSLALLFLAYFAVASRLWCRHLLRRKFFAHDALILCALLCSTGLVVLLIINVQYGGLGQHGADVYASPDAARTLIVFGKSLLAVQPIWSSSMTFVRLSILFLYINIFGTAHPRFCKACLAIMVLSLLWYLGDWIAVFATCKPLAYFWNPSIPGGKCGDTTGAYIAMHASNVFIDFSIAVVPVFVLWRLQMKLGKKIGIICMFFLGAIICAVSIARIALYKLLDITSPELTYDAGILYLFTVLEPLLGIILACMPLLRPAGNHIANSLMVSSAISWAKSFASSGRRTMYSTRGDKAQASVDGVPLHPVENSQYGRLKDLSKSPHIVSDLEGAAQMGPNGLY